MTGAFNNMNKGNVLINFLYIHIIFYENYTIESFESRLLSDNIFKWFRYRDEILVFWTGDIFDLFDLFY